MSLFFSPGANVIKFMLCFSIFSQVDRGFPGSHDSLTPKPVSSCPSPGASGRTPFDPWPLDTCQRSAAQEALPTPRAMPPRALMNRSGCLPGDPRVPVVWRADIIVFLVEIWTLCQLYITFIVYVGIRWKFALGQTTMLPVEFWGYGHVEPHRLHIYLLWILEGTVMCHSCGSKVMSWSVCVWKC